ncbi:MAG TPA: A24 family peptidase [Methylomirabilota bacterium]|jgi:leader peptidase (prepilin peptidase)/N-methyltransferase
MTLVPVVTFGLVIGSFVNVVIARVPQRRSLWAPRSSCPACGHPIAWYDNIPLLSFAVLKGRCRACAAPIPWRYPVVEAATATLFAMAWLVFGGDIRDFVVAAIFLAALVAITVIDLRHQIIPDALTLPGVVVGLVASLATNRLSWVESLGGMLLGAGLFVAVIVLSRGGMGGGDLKLGAMLGAFLGWKPLLVALFLAVMLGGICAVALLASGKLARKDAIPFGPFLALGGVVALFWGNAIVAWYLGGFDR